MESGQFVDVVRVAEMTAIMQTLTNPIHVNDDLRYHLRIRQMSQLRQRVLKQPTLLHPCCQTLQ
jgi:hypothetical protein